MHYNKNSATLKYAISGAIARCFFSAYNPQTCIIPPFSSFGHITGSGEPRRHQSPPPEPPPLTTESELVATTTMLSISPRHRRPLHLPSIFSH